MDIYFEHFFIQKIRQGLRGYPPLSPDEEDLLLTPISDLAISEKFSPDQATSLENKCVAALTNAYKEDTAGRNKEGAQRGLNIIRVFTNTPNLRFLRLCKIGI